MRKYTRLLSTVALTVALLLAGSTAYGQLEETEYPDEPHWDLNLNSGVLVAQNDLYITGMAIDDENLFEETADTRSVLGLGADLTHRFDNGFTMGGQFAWSPLEREFNEEVLFNQPFLEDPGLTRDVNMYLYSGNIGYTASAGRLGVQVSAGIGGVTHSFETGEIENFLEGNQGIETTVEDIFDETNNETNWQTPLTVGAKYAVTRSVTINAMARDYIVYGDGFNDASSNFYFGGGISFLF